jgi:CheY-specific phosphatase CheX
MKFSQRIEKTTVRKILQVNFMDDDLKNSLWNVILEDFFYQLDRFFSEGYYLSKDKKNYMDIDDVCKFIWKNFLKLPIDEIPSISYEPVRLMAFYRKFKEIIFSKEWYMIYDFIEFIMEEFIYEVEFLSESEIGLFSKKCNEILKRESAGYRIVGSKVVPINSEEEICEMEQALSGDNIWSSVSVHLKTALGFLSNRKFPDYRNSIKESISAVEAVCNIITGNTKKTLGEALIEVDKKLKIHEALKKGFSAIYGYTSDANGIRHYMLDSSISPSFEDAKFMLVICSAFVNYLRAKVVEE